MKSPLARFVLQTLFWLPLTFTLWYFMAPLLLWPVHWLAALIARVALSDIVARVESAGNMLNFVTLLRPGTSAGGSAIAVEVNVLLYAFGLPLFAALTLAARNTHWMRTLAAGYLALLPFVAWGVLADFLKNVAVTASPLVISQTGFAAWQRELIVIAYQFGALILPAVAPAIAWVLMHRAFLERMRGSGGMSR